MQIADGVADAHSAGIIHGDLRPDTIIVTTKGSAKILDFGLAQWTKGGMLRNSAAKDPDALPPESASVLGYLSPEQAIGSAVDPRTDIFSIGTLTYELLTGRNPFVAATAGATVMNVIQGKFTPASEVNPAVPPELDAILAHALTPDLARRQQSAAALAAELRSVAAVLDVRTGDAAAPSAVLPIDDAADKSMSGLIAVALALAAAAAAGVWWYMTARCWVLGARCSAGARCSCSVALNTRTHSALSTAALSTQPSTQHEHPAQPARRCSAGENHHGVPFQRDLTAENRRGSRRRRSFDHQVLVRDDAGQRAVQDRLVHRHDGVNQLADDVERDRVGIEIPRQAVGERWGDVDGDETPGGEGLRKRTRRRDLHADHARGRRERLHGDRDPADQPAAADRHDHRVDDRQIVEQLQRNRARAGDHVGMRVRGDVQPASTGGVRLRLPLRFVIVGTLAQLGAGGADARRSWRAARRPR